MPLGAKGAAHGSRHNIVRAGRRSARGRGRKRAGARRRTQRLSDFGARRLRVRMHESQRRDAKLPRKCSCSIDIIASICLMIATSRRRRCCGCLRCRERWGPQFRSTEIARTAVEDLRRAQRKRRYAASERVAYMAGSAGHSPLKTWPSVSTASARNVVAPFGMKEKRDVGVLRDRYAAIHVQHQLIPLPDPQFAHDEKRNVEQRTWSRCRPELLAVADHDLRLPRAARRSVARLCK